MSEAELRLSHALCVVGLVSLKAVCKYCHSLGASVVADSEAVDLGLSGKKPSLGGINWPSLFRGDKTDWAGDTDHFWCAEPGVARTCYPQLSGQVCDSAKHHGQGPLPSLFGL